MNQESITYKFCKSACWYRDVCNNYNNDAECNDCCIRYMEMWHLINYSGLPKKLQRPAKLYPDKVDLDSFRYLNSFKEEITEFVEAGVNLFLCSSNCGNGKTTWAAKFLLSYFDDVWNGNGFVPRGKFVYVPDFLNEVKQNLQNSEVLESTANLLKNLDLVVWDDIAIRRLTNFEQSYLTAIIDYRQNEVKSNIFTSNVLPNELEANVGSRLSSRLCCDEIVILKGQDMRRRKNIGNSTNFE